MGIKTYQSDKKTKLITKYSVTSALPHASIEIENIVDTNDKELHVDSKYRSKEIEKYLEKQNCKSNVHEKGYRGNRLTEEMIRLKLVQI